MLLRPFSISSVWLMYGRMIGVIMILDKYIYILKMILV